MEKLVGGGVAGRKRWTQHEETRTKREVGKEQPERKNNGKIHQADTTHTRCFKELKAGVIMGDGERKRTKTKNRAITRIKELIQKPRNGPGTIKNGHPT